MVFLMMLRRMPEYIEIVRNRRWDNQLPIRSIYGNTFTILGTGNIGQEVASRLRGMGAAKIVGVSRSGKAVPGFDEVLPISQLDEALKNAHNLIMALPGTPETVGLLNRQRIAMLPQGAYVVNVGRGTAIEQSALMGALESGHLAGAALDVMDPEPLPVDHPLWSAKNLIITPHVSGNMTLDYTCNAIVDSFCADLKRYAAGQPLKNIVNRQLGY
jgi:phosphoglycerate dehydrogenase-like enzyme